MHYILLPEPDMSLIDDVIERRVARMQEIVELGRKARDTSKLPLKFPCRTLVLVCSEPDFKVFCCLPPQATSTSTSCLCFQCCRRVLIH